jgi:hypothetical protein
MAENYKRPDGFPFTFGGINLRTSPESIPSTQYASAKNIRADSEKGIKTRPGYILISTSKVGDPYLGIRAYSTLGTDNLPRFLIYDDNGRVLLDDGTSTVAMTAPWGQGACMLPFRPNQSPQSWMYISTLGDYRKFCAPDAFDFVNVAKVGIAESSSQLEYAPAAPSYTDVSGAAANWTPTGTAGATSDQTRSTDTTIAIFADPVIATRFSAQVATTVPYQAGELLSFTKSTGGTIQALVQDILPPIPTGAGLIIQAIRYVTGATGRCTIVPSQITTKPRSSSAALGDPISALRRGCLVSLKASETVLVLSVTTGADGSQAFECVTAGTFAAGDAIDGIPAIIVDGITSAVVGQTVTSANISSAVTTGKGLLDHVANPFNLQLAASGRLPQSDDYIHMSLSISDYTLINEIKVLFDIDSATHDYQHNAFYYAIAVAPLAKAAADKITHAQTISDQSENQVLIDQLEQLNQARQDVLAAGMPTGPAFFGPDNTPYINPADQARFDQAMATVATIDTMAASVNASIASNSFQSASGYEQWTEIIFPISALNRIGGNLSRMLSDCYSIRVHIDCTAAVTVKVGSVWVGGGGQPDTGESNPDYYYRAVPRGATGAIGNPTPISRYGVRPRRQQVTVNLPSAAYDTQIEYWDIYRYGGTVTSWRYIGTALAASSTFTDNYFDSAALAGKSLEVDNFEPWPSIDVPYTVTPGGGTTITVTGTFVVISGPATWPATILRWLPGTLITLNGLKTYTLRTRPTTLSATIYLFELSECANFGTASSFTVNEPIVGRQRVPYSWGPDEQGEIFAVGDALRPGSVYFCKPNNPDSARDRDNLELCPPSEPLIGGEVIKGVSLVASTKRWWALYPNFNTNSAQRYTKLEQSVGRPLISPYGHCSDGQTIFFWTKDCIAATSGGQYKSLTDDALYTLFPHEGIPGTTITRNGVTYYAPDYKRSATFRLCVANKVLYADYCDINGTHRTLVCNLTTGAWSTDVYHDEMTLHYYVEQQSGTLLTSTALYPTVVMGDTVGNLWKQADNANDDDTPIACVVATFEWDGADQRGNDLWGDQYLVSIPNSVITATPVYLGASAAAATVIPAAASRSFAAISVGGGALLNYLGLQLAWTDDFTVISVPTQLLFWQPSLIQQVETTNDRFGDWDDCGTINNKFFQGVIIEADTFNVAKSIQVRDSDTLTLHALQPATVQHNGRNTKAYTFATPFSAHLVRDEPQDLVPWRRFALQYISEPTPELGRTWETQFTAHGLTGFHHIGKIETAYSALAAVTLTITSYDGTSPAVITLPATTGIYRKLLVHPTFNKGQLYKYSAISSQPFQIYLNDFIVWLGEWNRQSGYIPYRLLGGTFGDNAKV